MTAIDPPDWSATSIPDSPEQAREEIDRRSRDIVAAILREPVLHGQIAGSKAFIDQAAIDYAGRFLYELVQNAYDAHPAGTAGGRIHVLLDPTAGESGVLYVANTGQPFDREDVRAICEIAQSSKKPGEGIGNKGVGFKSVLLVTDWPEIFSKGAQVSPDSFTGYCFGFATDNDLTAFAGGNPGDAATVMACASRYTLPVPAESDARVNAFARAGMVSVIRLPLRGFEELKAARTQMEQLRSPGAPVLLFLDRIGELVLHDLGGGDPFVMTRIEQHLFTTEDAVVSEVALGDDGTYVVAQRHVSQEAFVGAVRASVDRRLLDPSWLDWADQVTVSVAVPASAGKADDRLYAFLPMGPDAHGPFPGHINAPFAIRLARDLPVANVPLNELLLDEAAQLCADVAIAVREHPAARSVVPDLVCWRAPDHSRLSRAFAASGRELADAAVLPTLGKAGWSSIRGAYRWDDPSYTLLTARSFAVAAGATIVDASVGLPRVDRIEALHQAVMGGAMRPGGSVLAEWTEKLAADLLVHSKRGRFEPEVWATFYDELALAFTGGPEALAGRRLILDADLTLQRALGPSEMAGPAVYFPQTEREAEESDVRPDLGVPASLRRSIAYVHAAIPFYVLNPQSRYERRAGRRFLEDRNLVRPFTRRALFERVRDVLATTRSKRIYADALKFAYNLSLNAPYNQRPSLSELNLRVPTRSGWIDAQRARFGAGWPGTQGTMLEQLTTIADSAPELAGISDRLLLAPTLWTSRTDSETWEPFLRRVGVKDGLWPMVVPGSKASGAGYQFAEANWLSVQLGLSPEDRSHFGPAAAAALSISHPYTPYRVDGQIARLPGQAEFARLSHDARILYGRLVIEGLPGWGDWIESFRVIRPNHSNRPDEQHLPSPAWTFLNSAAWMPVSRPGQPGLADLVPPAAAWTYQETPAEAQPQFAPLLISDVRARISRDPRLATRLAALGVKEWSDAANAGARLPLLTDLFASGIADSQLASLRKAYERSWNLLVTRDQPLPWTKGQRVDLLVTKSGQLALVRIDGAWQGQPVHVLVEQDARFAESLLASLDRPLLAVEGKDAAAVSRRLAPLLGTALRPVRSEDFRVFVDGGPVEPSAALPRLAGDERSWLVDILAMTLELKAPALNRQTENTIREAAEQMRRIHLQAGRTIHLELDGEPLDLPAFLPPVLAVPHEVTPVIAFRGSADPLTWPTLELLAPFIASLAGQTWSGAELRSAMTSLGRLTGADILVPPTDEDLSMAFGHDVRRIVDVRRSQRTFLDELLYRVRPAVRFLLGGDAEADVVSGLDASDPRAAMLAAIGRHALAQGREVDPSAVMSIAEESKTLEEVRDRLGAPFGEFNEVLTQLGRPYAPIRHEEEHIATFAAYLSERRLFVLDALRAAALPTFDAGLPVTTYGALTDQLGRAIGRRDPNSAALSLTADPAWLDVYALPPAEVMAIRLAEWMSGTGADPAGSTGLLDVDATRRANEATLTRLARSAGPVVAAWSTRNEVAPPAWASIPESLVGILAGQGDLDQRVMDESQMLARVAAVGQWPTGMPETIDLVTLQLTSGELERQRSVAEQRKWAAERERRAIPIGDRSFTLDSEERDALLAAVRETLSAEFLATPPGPATLGLMTPGGGRRLDHPPRGKPGGLERLSDAKKELIGFVGELAVFEWLRKAYGVGPESWVSRNRRFVFSDYEGRDDRGYDFEVPRQRGGSLLIEVKSSGSPDRYAFELTETEILRAREHRSSRRYQVAFVSNVLTAERHLLLLPNPVSVAGEGRYRIAGTGIRYEFDPIAD
jgi:hypothetical protein